MMIAFDYPTRKDRQINTLANGVSQVGQPSPDGAITVRFTLTADEGVTFKHDDKNQSQPARVTLFVQRCKDDYRKEDYRWWWTDSRQLHRIANTGEVEIVASFADLSKWQNLYGKYAVDRTGGFRSAIDNACNVGIAFGGGNAAAHGNWATGPARMEITRFEVR